MARTSIYDNSAGRKALEAEINQIEHIDVTNPTPSLSPTNLQRLTYTAPTDEELLNSAKNSLAEYKQQGVQGIVDNSAENAKALQLKRSYYQADMADELGKLDDSYNAASSNIDNDAVKRGLARSSIAVTQKADLEGKYMEHAAKIRSDYGKMISELDDEIASVDQKLKKALNDFNLTYAVKLNETLNNLKAAREQRQTEVIKYNNELARMQAGLDESRLKTESELYGEALDNRAKAKSAEALSEKERDAMYQSVYDKMDAFLSSMSPEQAKIEIRNHSLYQTHLDSYYYYKLYDKYGR